MIGISNLQLLMTHQIYICNFLSTQKYYLKSFYSFNSKLISFPPHSDDMASLAGCFFLGFHIPSMLSIILLKLFLIYPFTFFFFPHCYTDGIRCVEVCITITCKSCMYSLLPVFNILPFCSQRASSETQIWH